MKRTIKIVFIFLFALFLFSIRNTVDANSIQSIDMNIFIDENGDANITEIWKCNVTQGTEVYHPYYNLGNSVIKDLIVKDADTQYEQVSYWDTSGTLESKANKSGINQIDSGVELCWGISKYGSHTYTAKYTITNFVSETTDAQMIYWTLIPYEFSNSIGNVFIRIYTDFNIDDTTDVWGYGNYGGTAYVYNGNIEMQSDGILGKNEYMTILAKFPLGTFNTTNKLDYDFEYYYNMAEDGAIKYSNEIGNYKKIIFSVVILAFAFEIILIFIAFLIISIIKKHSDPDNRKFEYGKDGAKIPKDVPYYRDIPCEKDIYKAYFIGYKYGIVKNKTDLLGTIILKWLKDGIIRIEEKEKMKTFKKENMVIILKDVDLDMFSESKEKELFKMLYKASKDGCLESKEFEIWCKKKYSKILSWFNKILFQEYASLIKEGLIEVKEKKIFKGKVYKATPQLRQEAINLAGLKRYLNEYTMIKEREAIEVKIFEEYLIFAQLMGIAKKVANQFKDVYPKIMEQSKMTSYNNILFINISSYRATTIAQSARAEQLAKLKAKKYSAGGKGFSSGGGGRGSFGGGGGGRRLPLK